MIGPRSDLGHAILRAIDECGEIHIRRDQLDNDNVITLVVKESTSQGESAMFSRGIANRSFLGLEGMLVRQIHMLVDDLTGGL